MTTLGHFLDLMHVAILGCRGKKTLADTHWQDFQAHARAGIEAERLAHKPAKTAKWQRDIVHKALRS